MNDRMLPWPLKASHGAGGPPVVGAVIVNWNTRGLLARLLYGLTRVLEPDAVSEIVVVDNGSDDGSVELASALSDAGLIRLVANDTQRYHGPGLTQGVNVLSKLARNGVPVDLVWLLDTDVFILRRDVLADAAAALNETGACFAGERDDYRPGPTAVTDQRLALCSVLFEPAVVWQPEHRPFLDDGEPARAIQEDLLASKRKLLAFPFCTAGYLVHLGRGTLAEVKKRADEGNQYHHWAEDHSDPHYGLIPDGEKLAARFEALYRAAAGNESDAELLELFVR